MYLLDSNILIYSSKKEYAHLRAYITNSAVISAVSVATIIEVLGYHKLTELDKTYFESCFSILRVLEVDTAISAKAVELRQQKKMSLGDAIIAATALLYNYELVTRNTSDFANITGLRLTDPFAPPL